MKHTKPRLKIGDLVRGYYSGIHKVTFLYNQPSKSVKGDVVDNWTVSTKQVLTRTLRPSELKANRREGMFSCSEGWCTKITWDYLDEIEGSHPSQTRALEGELMRSYGPRQNGVDRRGS